MANEKERYKTTWGVVICMMVIAVCGLVPLLMALRDLGLVHF